MEIRFAEPQDVGGILALLQQIGQLHHEGRPDIFRDQAQKYSASQVLALLNSSKTPIFVAVEAGKVLGYCFCQVKTFENQSVVYDHTELYIDDLCVDEACRGQHIGTTLYNEVLRYAKMRRCHNVTLNVWSFNEKAMQFYKSLGMQPQRIFMETILESNDA